MSNNKFMSCPFCGKNPRILYQGRFCTIIHKNCASGVDIIGTFDSEDKAVKAWNARHERTCKPIQREYISWLGRPIMGEFCQCGHLLEDFGNYCSNCGVKIVEQRLISED